MIFMSDKPLEAGNYIPINNKALLAENNIHLTHGTLRKWSSAGHNAQLFLKICNRLHIDLHEWDKIVEAAKLDREKRVERLQRLGLLPEGERL